MAIRRVVLPALTVIVGGGGSLRVLTSATLPDNAYSACQTSLISSTVPASDVVFFGSSRTGAAIDTMLIGAALTGGETAEKVVYTLGSELDRDLAIRTYVTRRGAPQAIALELSFERYADRIVDDANIIAPTDRTTAFFGLEAYTAFVGSMDLAGRVHPIDILLRSRLRSPLRYLLDRVDLGWQLASRHPALAAAPEHVCTWNFGPRKGRWVVGNALPYTESVKQPRQDLLDKWSRQTKDFRDFAPADPWTRQEISMLDDMVDAARDAGIEHVILYYLPSYDERPTAIDLGFIAQRYPDATIFDAREVLDDPARPGLRTQHNDMNHVNRYGAGEISSAVADRIERLLRP